MVPDCNSLNGFVWTPCKVRWHPVISVSFFVWIVLLLILSLSRQCQLDCIHGMMMARLTLPRIHGTMVRSHSPQLWSECTWDYRVQWATLNLWNRLSSRRWNNFSCHHSSRVAEGNRCFPFFLFPLLSISQPVFKYTHTILFQRGNDLVKNKIHPTSIISGYRVC